MKIGQNQVSNGGALRPDSGRMHADGYEFSEELSGCSGHTFRIRFGRTARHLGLNQRLKREELGRLSEAAFLAALCNIAFNGLGSPAGDTRPENERVRRDLEIAYMDARRAFYKSTGWKKLPAAQRESIRAAFLTVGVQEKNLAA